MVFFILFYNGLRCCCRAREKIKNNIFFVCKCLHKVLDQLNWFNRIKPMLLTNKTPQFGFSTFCCATKIRIHERVDGVQRIRLFLRIFLLHRNAIFAHIHMICVIKPINCFFAGFPAKVITWCVSMRFKSHCFAPKCSTIRRENCRCSKFSEFIFVRICSLFGWDNIVNLFFRVRF